MEISLPVNLSEFVDEYFTIYLKEKKINMIFIYLMKINSALRTAIHLYKEDLLIVIACVAFCVYATIIYTYIYTCV